MTAGWTDITSYARGETNAEPCSWLLKNGGLRIVVTRRHGLEGWYLNCEPFFNYETMRNSDIMAAKDEAIVKCLSRFRDAVAFLERA
jgi:hypothetical protein